MKPALYVGTIAHRRHIPVEHRFQYEFFMWFLNLDELDVPAIAWSLVFNKKMGTQPFSSTRLLR